MPEWLFWTILVVAVPAVLVALRKIVKESKPDWDDRYVLPVLDVIDTVWKSVFKPMASRRVADAPEVQGEDKPADRENRRKD